jgi:hypothetical protein
MTLASETPFKKGDTVICIDPGLMALSIGRRYKVVQVRGTWPTIKGDNGLHLSATPERFVLDEVDIAKKILASYNLL